MNTEELIKQLAQAPAPARHWTDRWTWRFVAASLGGLTLALALLVLSSGVRPDLLEAWAPTALKIGFGLAAAGALAPLAWRAGRPNVKLTDAAAPAVIFVVMAALLTATSLGLARPELRWVLWTGGGAPDCLIRIPLISLPIAAALFFAARKFAPTRLAFAGAVLGAVAGALASIAYALFCPIDSAPFVASWYTMSIAICALLGAGAARALRW